MSWLEKTAAQMRATNWDTSASNPLLNDREGSAVSFTHDEDAGLGDSRGS